MKFLLLAVALFFGDLSYPEAYKQHKKENKPLMVIAGAEWCPACIQLKDRLKKAKEDGYLDGVVLTYVDIDKEPELFEKIKIGENLPQILVFDKEKRFSLRGLQSIDRIRELVKRALP